MRIYDDRGSLPHIQNYSENESKPTQWILFGIYKSAQVKKNGKCLLVELEHAIAALLKSDYNDIRILPGSTSISPLSVRDHFVTIGSAAWLGPHLK